jgi:hypothetical protein
VFVSSDTPIVALAPLGAGAAVVDAPDDEGA